MKIVKPIKYAPLIVLSVFIFVFQGQAQTADELLQKMDNIIFGAKDKQGNVKIILINSSGNEKVREATMLQKGTDKKVYRYTQPESQAGIATLSLPGGIMWLYMPAFGKPKKISLLAKSQAFTGTDFSYEDMATTTYASRYTAKLLETSEDAYVLELQPKEENPTYSKIIVTQNKQHFYPVKMEYYDRINNKFKEATYDYIKIGKYWNAEQVIMADLKKQHMTKIILSDVKFDQGLSDDEFTVEKLAPEKDPEE
jgi:outer membrane lipoprotein-sorting protein